MGLSVNCGAGTEADAGGGADMLDEVVDRTCAPSTTARQQVGALGDVR